MRKIMFLCVIILAGGIGAVIYSRSAAQHFGEQFKGEPAVSVVELIKAPETYVGKDVRVEGKITKQCMISGCWFHLDGGQGNELKVEFGMTVPQLPQQKGKIAIVEGRFMKSGDDYELIGSGVEFR